MSTKSIKKGKITLIKDNGELCNSCENYTGKGTVIYSWFHKKKIITERYEGNFLLGKKHGYGLYEFSNGDRYEGNYENDRKNGIGMYFYGSNRSKGKREDKKKRREKSTEEDQSEGEDEDGEEDEEDETDESDEPDESDESDESDEFDESDEYDESDESDEPDASGDNEEKTEEAKERQRTKLFKKFMKLLKNLNKRKDKKKVILNNSSKVKQIYYYGNYKNGLKHDSGMMVYENGDTYVGHWNFGKKNGWGTYTYKKCKSALEGIWKDGTFYYGKWALPNGTYLVGNFDNNKPIGESVWVFQGQTQLNVAYSQDKKMKPKSKKGKGKGKKKNSVTSSKVSLVCNPMYITTTSKTSGI